MPVNNADINYNRTFKIIFGTPEKRTKIIEEATVVVPLRREYIETSGTTVPADAVSYTNFKDGKFTRGVKFDMRSKRKVDGASSDSEITIINIFNMPEKDVKRLTREGSIIQVLAGYNGKMDLIYSGDVMGVYPKRSGNDLGYEIRCKDGGYSIKNQRVTLDYDENIGIADVMRDLASRFDGVSISSVALSALEDQKVTGGVSVQGKLGNIFQRMCKQYQLQYVRYNSKISIRPEQVVQGSEDYEKLVANNYNLTERLIKDIQPVLDNKGKLSEQKNTRNGVNVSTFLIPITLDQFFTIPETQKEYKGTYKATEIYVNLSFPNGAWDVSIKGEPT